MNKKTVFVDCEAIGPVPSDSRGWVMTEFGAVDYYTRKTFHGVLFDSRPSAANPAIPELVPNSKGYPRLIIANDFKAFLDGLGSGKPTFVSDNPAYDFMWIAHMFATVGLDNPFGHSGRRIGDFAAGLRGDFGGAQEWKKLRKTKHDHNPVNDAMGNVEAFAALIGD